MATFPHWICGLMLTFCLLVGGCTSTPIMGRIYNTKGEVISSATVIVKPVRPVQRPPDSPNEQCTYTTDEQGRFFCHELGGYRLRRGVEYQVTANKEFHREATLKFIYPSEEGLRLELSSSNDVKGISVDASGQRVNDGNIPTGLVSPP